MAKSHHGSPGSKKRRQQSPRPRTTSTSPPAGQVGGGQRPTVGSARVEAGRDTDFRRSLTQASAPLLTRMHAMPRFVLPVALGLMLATGLFLSGPVAWLGAILLLAVAAFLGWLLALSWPVIPVGGRLGRSLVVVGVLGLAYLKITGSL